jgi:hypothetical protein
MVRKLNPDYRLYIRHQPYIPAWETNLYAIWIVVLNKIKKSQYEWWGNTGEARDRIIKVVELFNSEEAEKEKNRLADNG